jgi:hypothetical protein
VNTISGSPKSRTISSRRKLFGAQFEWIESWDSARPGSAHARDHMPG